MVPESNFVDSATQAGNPEFPEQKTEKINTEKGKRKEKRENRQLCFTGRQYGVSRTENRKQKTENRMKKKKEKENRRLCYTGRQSRVSRTENRKPKK